FVIEIIRIFQSRLYKVWASAILLALLINILVGASASKPVLSYSGGIAAAMIGGMLVAFAGTFAAEAISSSFPKNPVYRNLVWFGIKIGLPKQKGYLRPISADVETNDPANWKYEEGHLRAVSYMFIVIVAYCIITGKQIAPL